MKLLTTLLEKFCDKSTQEKEIEVLKETNKILERECRNLRSTIKAAQGVLDKI